MNTQASLFTRPLPQIANPLDIHAVSLPAKTFTGDFWFTHRAGDRWWFALGDVSGKGLPAALVMAMIQEELEERIVSCARTACDPTATVQRLHEFLRPLLPRNRFATAVLGWLRDDGVLKLVNAGHCPPLILRAGGRIETIGSTGPVVGILPTAQWGFATHVLGAGDTLLLYSDGVIEAASSAGEEFGMEGIEQALAPLPKSAPARNVATAIVEAVQTHAPGARQDDLTVLVIAAGGKGKATARRARSGSVAPKSEDRRAWR
jgi:serine phosphatase RsbU (regulator of sigma subunit)